MWTKASSRAVRASGVCNLKKWITPQRFVFGQQVNCIARGLCCMPTSLPCCQFFTWVRWKLSMYLSSVFFVKACLLLICNSQSHHQRQESTSSICKCFWCSIFYDNAQSKTSLTPCEFLIQKVALPKRKGIVINSETRSRRIGHTNIAIEMWLADKRVTPNSHLSKLTNSICSTLQSNYTKHQR